MQTYILKYTTLLLIFLLLMIASPPFNLCVASSLPALLASLADQPPEERLLALRAEYLQHQNQEGMEGKRLLFLLGYWHFSLKHYAMSTLYFHQLLKSEYPALADYVHYYLAESLFALKQFEPALFIYQRLVSQFPSSLLVRLARFRIAEIAYVRGELAQALFLYTAYLKAYPDDEQHGEILYRRGLIYQELDKIAEAVQEWRHLWIENPTDPFAEQARKAEQQLRAVFSVPPPSPEQLYTRGNALYEASRFQEALEVYSKLLQQFSTSSWREKLLYQIAWCYYRLWQNEQAIETFQQFRREFPQSAQALEAYYTLGKLYLRLDQPSKFVAFSRTFLQEYPDSAYTEKILYLLGNLYEEQKFYPEALQLFQQLLSRFPRSPLAEDTLWHMGWTHYLLSQYSQAIHTWERLEQAYPRSKYLSDARYWQGRAEAKMQQWAEAVRSFHRVRELYPQTFYAQEADTRLQEISQIYPPAATLLQEGRQKASLDSSVFRQKELVVPSPKIQELWVLHLFKEAAAEMAHITPPQNQLSYYFQTAVAFYRAGEAGKAARHLRRHFGNAVVSGDADLPPLFWQMAYPLRFPERPEVSLPSNLDPRLVAAVILAESLWDADVRSPAGAIGLMQIMPHTGKRLAKEVGIDFPSEDILYDRRINLSLGTYYLSQLLQQFDHQIMLAIASYNAGEERGEKWWRRWSTLERDEFITNIPFFETRRYVQKVLAYYRMYQQIYPDHLFDKTAEQRKVE